MTENSPGAGKCRTQRPAPGRATARSGTVGESAAAMRRSNAQGPTAHWDTKSAGGRSLRDPSRSTRPRPGCRTARGSASGAPHSALGVAPGSRGQDVNKPGRGGAERPYCARPGDGSIGNRGQVRRSNAPQQCAGPHGILGYQERWGLQSTRPLALDPTGARGRAARGSICTSSALRGRGAARLPGTRRDKPGRR